jgi:GTP cyclohydrolase I
MGKYKKMVDEDTIRISVENCLKAIGDDPNREGLRDTPYRVAQMYSELFSGVDQDARDELRVGYELGHREMVILKDIPFYSMCEHHLLPFFGVAHVGYIPGVDGRVVGISKIARVVDIIARRPQIQERMATQVADALNEGLAPDGVGVVIEAQHLCMMMRGIKKAGSKVITSSIRGHFRSNPAARAEFMSLIRDK